MCIMALVWDLVSVWLTDLEHFLHYSSFGKYKKYVAGNEPKWYLQLNNISALHTLIDGAHKLWWAYALYFCNIIIACTDCSPFITLCIGLKESEHKVYWPTIYLLTNNRACVKKKYGEFCDKYFFWSSMHYKLFLKVQ